MDYSVNNILKNLMDNSIHFTYEELRNIFANRGYKNLYMSGLKTPLGYLVTLEVSCRSFDIILEGDHIFKIRDLCETTLQ